MKLVFYSSLDTVEDQAIHVYAAKLIGRRGAITYIPSTSNSTAYFDFFKRQFIPHEIQKYKYFDVEAEYTESDVHDAFANEAIFLSGGNTFSFLHILRKKDLLVKLKKYVADGGILLGQSAGALIMTPSITIAGLGPHPDENLVGLSDLAALDIVQFEFAPHFYGSSLEVDSLVNYRADSGRTIYACPDGAAIVVEEGLLTFFGNILSINSDTNSTSFE